MTRIPPARRHPARWLLALLLAPAFLLATPGVSNAAAPTPNYAFTAVDGSSGSFLVSRLTQPFDAGDCELDSTDTWVQLERPTADNGFTSFVNWHATGFTRHTNNADVWHNTFSFYNQNFAVVLTVGPLDGAKMRQVNHHYDWLARSGTFPLDPAVYDQIVGVDWRGEC